MKANGCSTELLCTTSDQEVKGLNPYGCLAPFLFLFLSLSYVFLNGPLEELQHYLAVQLIKLCKLCLVRTELAKKIFLLNPI